MGLVGVFRGGQYEAADCALVSSGSGKQGEKEKKCQRVKKEKRKKEKISTCPGQQKCVRGRCS